MTTTTKVQATQLDRIPKVVEKLRDNFNKSITKPLAWRQKQLEGMMCFLTDCKTKIQAALLADLKKCTAETQAAEIGFSIAELKYTLKHLKQWMKPKRVSTAMLVMPGYSHIYPEPLGVVLIISPWNYPIQLTLSPLIGAIAAGNCVLVKPSELAPATSQLLASELPKYLDNDCIQIIEGGPSETTAILAEKFDHILYTGNGNVARIVMSAAAKHLTPVTLELGGKSPCIIDSTTNLTTAARRIAWGKFSNAGQTCIAPDYILIEESVEEKFVEELKKMVHAFYGDNPELSPDYGRIINSRHHQRLMALIPDSGDVFLGGNGDEKDRYIAPTILRNVPPNSPVMADEIFGPILPVIKIKNINEAITFINSRPKPLSLYIFSSDSDTREKIIHETSSGGVCVNFPLMHVLTPSLPFGGVGPSGMGAYHGKYSFDTFSHFKSVLVKPLWGDLAIFFPPYTKKFLKLLSWLQ